MRWIGGVDTLGISSASRTLPKVTVQRLFYATYYTAYFYNQALKNSMLNGVHNDKSQKSFQ